jgi:hypothetical protein
VEAKRTAYWTLCSPWPGDRLHWVDCGQSGVHLRWGAEGMVSKLLLPVDSNTLLLGLERTRNGHYQGRLPFSVGKDHNIHSGL